MLLAQTARKTAGWRIRPLCPFHTRTDLGKVPCPPPGREPETTTARRVVLEPSEVSHADRLLLNAV